MNNVKDSIGWADKSWNVVTGCEHYKTGICAVKNCYAKRLAEGRLRGRCGYDKDNPFKPTYHKNRLEEPLKLKKPSMIFVSDMGDLFGEWIDKDWIEWILGITKLCSQHTFLFLTKNPKRYQEFEFPDNCWLGTTINCRNDLAKYQRDLWMRNPKEPEKALKNITFASFEPLYEGIADIVFIEAFDWIIIGGQSKPNKPPSFISVSYLLKKADKHNIPVFMKDNIGSLWKPKMRKEFPK